MKAPLSHNQLGNMMANICSAADMRRYTNHCIRVMKSAGGEDCKIITLSGHKNVNSLASYSCFC